MKKIIVLIIFLNFLSAVEIRLSPPADVSIKNGWVVANFTATDTLAVPEIQEYLQYGVILTFTYTIHLVKDGFLWFDEKLSSFEITKKVHYDIWSEKYFVESSVPTKRKVEFYTIESLREHLKNLKDVKIIEIKNVEEGNYYFQTRNTIAIRQENSLFHIVFNLLSVFKYKSTYLESKIYTKEGLFAGKPTKKKPLILL